MDRTGQDVPTELLGGSYYAFQLTKGDWGGWMGEGHAAAGQWLQPGSAMWEAELHASTLQQQTGTLAASPSGLGSLSLLLYLTEK